MVWSVHDSLVFFSWKKKIWSSKHVNDEFLTNVQINRWTKSCGLLVDYSNVLSAVWTLILTTHSLWRNKLFYILDGLTVSTFSGNVNLGVNCSFKVPQSLCSQEGMLHHHAVVVALILHQYSPDSAHLSWSGFWEECSVQKQTPANPFRKAQGL